MASTDGMTFDDLMGGEKTDAMAHKTEKRPRTCSYLGWTEAMDAIVSKTNKDQMQVVIGDDWRGDKAVLIQNHGETGNWPARFETPPMIANYPRLSGDGNLGTKFAPEKKDASFEVTLSVGELEQAEDDVNKNEITLNAQKSFVDNIRDRSIEAFKLMWVTDGILEQKKAKIIKSYAKMKKIDPKKVDKNDEDLVEMFVEENMGMPVKFNKEPVQFPLKSRAFKRDFKSGSDELHCRPIPIYNAGGDQVNSEDNDTDHVERGDLVTCEVAMSSYMVNGNFGCKFELKSVTILKKGSGGSKKRKTNWGSLMMMA